MSDAIFVNGLALHAYHGVMPHEGKVGQTFKLDLVLDTGVGQNFLDMRVARASGMSLGAHFLGHGAGAGTIDIDSSLLRMQRSS